MTSAAEQTRRSIEAVWRLESARLIGALVRQTRSLDLAEDLAQQALLEALERWPQSGIPDRPGAWLLTTARNRGLDLMRRGQMIERKHEALVAHASESQDPLVEADEAVGDDTLRLMLIACHPVLAREARAALTLRLLGGLSTAEIARAFLSAETTIAQRIVRAKRTLAEAQVPFELPEGDALRERVESLLEVIYLIFNEGYSATAGDDLLRPELCDDALRLGRALSHLLLDEAEVHGLLALMELQASRLRTRTAADGSPILLLDQNRARWDHLQIRRGLAALERAEALASPLGPYALQAAIAATHARARRPEDTDWKRIVALYDALCEVIPSPVIELNRAVAVGMAFGAQAALELVEQLESASELRDYHLLPSVKGEFLERLGRREEARQQFRRAASLAGNARERELLLRRAGSS